MIRTAHECIIDRHAILFFDDAIFAERKNVRSIYHTPEKDARNPILRPELPWEGSRIQPWGSVYPWEGKWRVLCNGYGNTDIPGVFVLETEDGSHWYRPSLGLHEHNGSTDNSLLIPCPVPGAGFQFLPSLIRHPSPPDPSFTWLLYLWAHLHSTPEKPQCALYLHKSSDGLHFEQVGREPVIRMHDWQYGPGRANDVLSVYYDTQAGCFTMYAAVVLPAAPGHEVLWDNAPHVVRRLARWESADGITWNGPHFMLEPDRHEPAWQQYYGVTVSEYEGLWLGFPLYYHVAEQFMHPHLIVSTDRRVWQRPSRQPFIPSGDSPSRWDFGGIFPAWDFLRLNDTLIFPYGGMRQREHTNRAEMHFGVARLRHDGFVSLSPGDASATYCEFQTIPLCGAGGKELLVNTEPDWHTGDDRWITVAVEDADGRPVPGYTWDDCGCRAADGIRVPIRWKERTRLPALPRLRLRIGLRKQRLYALRFAD